MNAHAQETDAMPAASSWIPSADWRRVEQEIDRIARRKGELDYDEARWLLAARKSKVHVQLACSSFVEYVSRRLGYGHKLARDKIHVAECLCHLPLLREALRTSALPWSAVRELVRVALPDTEQAWVEAASGKTVREVELMVSGRRPGDLPADPKRPELLTKVLKFAVNAELAGRYLLAAEKIRAELGSEVTEEVVLQVMVDGILGGCSTEPARGHTEVRLTVCTGCQRTWQEAGGETTEIEPVAADQALCDCRVVGVSESPDAAPHEGRPTWLDHLTKVLETGRAFATVTEKTRREVLARTNGKCAVPGCRNHRWIQLHHLDPRAEGGSHDDTNLIGLCHVHHCAWHKGLLRIEGRPSTGLRFFHADGRPYGARPSETPAPRDVPEAIQALRALGFSASQARSLLAEAQREQPEATRPEELVAAAARISARGLVIKIAPSVADHVSEPRSTYGGSALDPWCGASLTGGPRGTSDRDRSRVHLRVV